MKNWIFTPHLLALLALFTSIGLCPLSVSAEGSKNLTPGTAPRGDERGVNNFIGYLQHDDEGNSRSFPGSPGFLKPNSNPLERLYIHMEPGEKLYYGLRRIPTTGGTNGGDNGRLRLQIKYGTITAMTTTLLPAPAPNPKQATLAPAAGVIATPEQAAVGPNYGPAAPAGGYNPLVFENTSGSKQEVWIEFAQVDAAGIVTAALSKAWYDCWDFTVRDDANANLSLRGEKPGRLYSSAWSFTGADFDFEFATTFALYPLIPNPNFGNVDFFVKRVSYSRIEPFGTVLTANEFGTTVGGSDYMARRKSQPSSAGNVGYAEYKLFVNDPDNAVYPSTRPPTAPTITTTCSGTVPTGTTTFTLDIDQAGFGIVFIDGNNNQTYESAFDRVLEKQTVVTTPTAKNEFLWDGKTDSGAIMPEGTINLVFSSGVGPVNFPMFDCEKADAAGITVRSVRPGNNNGFTDFLFYDDTNLGANFSTPIRNPIGNNSLSGAHKWGANGSGDGLTVNTYAVGLLAQGRAFNVAYKGTGCVVLNPIILTPPLPVELTRFGAVLRNEGVRVGWETASEKNCDYFAVERSATGRAFEAVAQVKGSGNSAQKRTYAALDPAPLAGVSYYRLRQVDHDGTAYYSPVETVVNAGRAVATLFPNPATSEVNIRFAAALAGPVSIRVLDATGRLLWQERRVLAEPRLDLQVPVSQLPATGLYFVQVSNGGPVSVYRFNK